MFGRAPVKRFNDLVPSGPAPSDYNVKEVQSNKSGVPLVKSSRHVINELDLHVYKSTLE